MPSFFLFVCPPLSTLFLFRPLPKLKKMNSEWCLGFRFFWVHFAFFAKWTKSIPPYPLGVTTQVVWDYHISLESLNPNTLNTRLNKSLFFSQKSPSWRKKKGFLTRLGCPALKRPEVAFGLLTRSFRVLCPKMPPLQRAFDELLSPFSILARGVLNVCECCCLLLQLKSLSLWDY